MLVFCALFVLYSRTMKMMCNIHLAQVEFLDASISSSLIIMLPGMLRICEFPLYSTNTDETISSFFATGAQCISILSLKGYFTIYKAP